MLKDRRGKNFEKGQKVIYVDEGVVDGEIISVRPEFVEVKIMLRLPFTGGMISVGNLTIVDYAPGAQEPGIGQEVSFVNRPYYMAEVISVEDDRLVGNGKRPEEHIYLKVFVPRENISVHLNDKVRAMLYGAVQ